MTTLSIPGLTPAAPGRPQPAVIGLDLSLKSTGIYNGTTPEALIPKGLDGHARLEWQRREVAQRITDADLVVIEGPAMSLAYRPGVEEMTYLRGLVKHDLWKRGIPYAVCPPQHRIIYATGVANPAKDSPKNERGRVCKGMVRTAVQERYGVACEGPGKFDQADAVILHAMGCHWLGRPLAVVPDDHRRALASVQWPVIVPAVAS